MFQRETALVMITLLIGVLSSTVSLGGEASIWGTEELNDAAQYFDGVWIPFCDTASSSSPRVEVLESNEQKCIVSVETFGMYSEKVEIDGKAFEKLSVPDCGFLYDFGKPQIPAIRRWIEIPWGKSVHAKAIASSFSLPSEYSPYPCQKPIPLSADGPDEIPFQFDEAFYSSDVSYPDSLVSVSAPSQLRNHAVVQLSVYPIQYNPASKALNVSTTIRVELEYYGPQTYSAASNNLYSPSFEDICGDVILNYGSTSRLAFQEETKTGYLVISHDSFYPAIELLAEWKKLLGFEVTSVKLSDINANRARDEDIYNYIRYAYYNWITPPTYVLLVGDNSFLPTHFGMLGCDLELTATDNYYACMNSEDYLPDLFVGRLSVRTVSELNDILEKLLSYQGFFNKRAAVISAAPESGDTLVGWFPGSDYYCDLACGTLASNGFVCDKFYWSLYNFTKSNVINAINNGRAIINYFGHGDLDGWANQFTKADIHLLTNAEKYPIVFSLACGTGEYDIYTYDCFGEALMKAGDKGAVAFWGSSRTAEGPFVAQLSQGVMKAMFDDHIDEFGPMTVKAKLFLYDYYGGDQPEWKSPDSQWSNEHIKFHFEIFNVLTDPQLCTTYRTSSHDVTVLSATSNITKAYVGQLINVEVVVKNVGASSETFNVTAYCGNHFIGTHLINDLPAGSIASSTFVWDTTGADVGNFTLKAVAKAPGEVRLRDNICIADVIELLQAPGPLTWVPYNPSAYQVTINYQHENYTKSDFDLSIAFPSSGFRVSDFGTPTIVGSNISVSAEVWDYTGLDIPKPITVSHTYSLGEPPAGNYLFTFECWATSIKTISFTVPVVVPDDYPTIQEAINAANPRDLIYVRGGTYYENIVVNKTLSLVGESRATTIIDGSGHGTVVNVTENQVLVSSFTIQNSSNEAPNSGVYLAGSSTIVRNNIITNNSVNLLLDSSSDNRIYNNIITNAAAGIVLNNSCNNNTIEYNRITNIEEAAIEAFSSEKNRFLGNTIENNQLYTIRLNSANKTVFIGNTFANNSHVLVEIRLSATVSIWHNNFISSSGNISVFDSFDIIWDNGCEGNYWSDYNGTDLNNDCIGDTFLPWEGVDNYPLMNRYWHQADINHDMKCDIEDIARISGKFGSYPGHPKWNPHCDITGPEHLIPDGAIDISDLAVVSASFGKYYGQ